MSESGPLIAIYTGELSRSWAGRQLSPGKAFVITSREVGAVLKAGWPLYTSTGALVVNSAHPHVQPLTINPSTALPLPKGARA